MPPCLRITAIAFLLMCVSISFAHAQQSPFGLTNRHIGQANDASSTSWNPSLLGLRSDAYDFLLGLPFRDRLDFQNVPTYGFVKAGPLGFGISFPWIVDSAANALGLVPTHYYLGLGFPLTTDKLWVGAGVRWRDGGGFAGSGEYTASATYRVSPSMLASATLENITGNNNAEMRLQMLGAYSLFEWATMLGSVRYDPLDTLAGESPIRLGIGLNLGLVSEQVHLNAVYDLVRKDFRVGLEAGLAAGETAPVISAATFLDIEESAGMTGGAVVLRFTSRTQPALTVESTSESITTRRDPHGWAPDRAYSPVGLHYKYTTNDAAASSDALVRPCVNTTSPFDTPEGLVETINNAPGKVYTTLARKLSELTPRPSELYKAIRSTYYGLNVRNRELMRGDSLQLISRQGYSIGVQSVDQSKFPEVSVIVQATDANGRNVRGLGMNDFQFRDSNLKIKSVRPLDASFSVPVDIVMIVDCSGSMRDEIQSVRANVESFVNTLQARGADYRIGGVMYGAMIYDTLHPTNDVAAFKRFAANADAIGTDEITTLALKAATEMNFRPGSQRLFVLITDDWQVQDNAGLSESDVVDMLWNTGARLCTIGNPCSNNGAVMTRLSLGREYNITSSFNSILDEIGNDVTTQYEIVYESKTKQEAVTVLRGRLRDETGRPATIPIRLRAADGTQFTVTPNATTGEYQTDIIEGRRYDVSIGGGRYLPFADVVDLTTTTRGDTVARNFTMLLPPTVITGTVTDENGRPIAAEVRIEDAVTGERITSVRSDAAGRFETQMAEGRQYRLTAINPDYIPTPAELDTRGVERGTRLAQDLRVMSIEYAIANGTTFKVKNIFFDFAKWDLKPESYLELNRLVALLGDYPRINVEIGAHTDAIGSDRDNMTLSGNRAASVVDYLVNKGITRGRLRSKGYGESIPVATNDSEEGRALNRRVEFKLVR